jgi:hypothetical protein
MLRGPTRRGRRRSWSLIRTSSGFGKAQELSCTAPLLAPHRICAVIRYGLRQRVSQIQRWICVRSLHHAPIAHLTRCPPLVNRSSGYLLCWPPWQRCAKPVRSSTGPKSRPWLTLPGRLCDIPGLRPLRRRGEYAGAIFPSRASARHLSPPRR